MMCMATVSAHRGSCDRGPRGYTCGVFEPGTKKKSARRTERGEVNVFWVGRAALEVAEGRVEEAARLDVAAAAVGEPVAGGAVPAWAPEFGGRKWVLRVRDWPSQNGVFGFG